MQTIKNQLLAHINNPLLKNYLQNNIFGQEALRKQRNAFVGNFNSNHQINSSSMFSSYLSNKKNASARLNIKQILNNMEKRIIANGFAKNIHQINQLKKKTQNLKKLNQQLQKKLQKSLYNQNKIFNLPQKIQKLGINENKYKESQYYGSAVDSTAVQQISYTEQIKLAQQKYKLAQDKQRLIAVITLTTQQRLQRHKKRVQQLKLVQNQVKTLHKLVYNIQNIHPQQSQIQAQVQQIQKQYDQKSMLVQNDSRLQLENQIIKRKIQLLENQIYIFKNTNQFKSPNANNQPQKLQIINNNQDQQHYQPTSRVRSQNHKLYDSQIKEQLKRLILKKEQLQEYISGQQRQKSNLIEQINNFNQKYNVEKRQNKQLVKDYKQTLSKNQQFANFISQKYRQNPNKYQFLINYQGQ